MLPAAAPARKTGSPGAPDRSRTRIPNRSIVPKSPGPGKGYAPTPGAGRSTLSASGYIYAQEVHLAYGPMGKSDDWYRNDRWDAAEEKLFLGRLKRQRGPLKKAQVARIKAT